MSSILWYGLSYGIQPTARNSTPYISKYRKLVDSFLESSPRNGVTKCQSDLVGWISAKSHFRVTFFRSSGVRVTRSFLYIHIKKWLTPEIHIYKFLILRWSTSSSSAHFPFCQNRRIRSIRTEIVRDLETKFSMFQVYGRLCSWRSTARIDGGEFSVSSVSNPSEKCTLKSFWEFLILVSFRPCSI